MVIGIVGLGLMGGSLALALRKNASQKPMILGSDKNPEHVKKALDLGIIDASADLEEMKRSAEIIILAAPVGAIKYLLSQMEDIPENCTVIDLGSTKASIIEATPAGIRKNLVAAHPMAGTEYSGPEAAFATLFDNKIVVLCDLKDSGAWQQKQARELFETIGMKIVTMEAKAHDRHAAYISHMPHVISYAIANSVLAQEDKKSILTLAAGGFRDMSRLAKSPYVMWRDIFMENKPALMDSFDVFEKELATARKLLEAEDWEALSVWMKSANTLHELFDA